MSYLGLVEKWLKTSDDLAVSAAKQPDWAAQRELESRVQVYRECATDLAKLLKKQGST